jgi:hypothetical protein
MWNICSILVQHMCIATATYVTSRWNTCNILLKQMEHLKYTFTTYLYNNCNIYATPIYFSNIQIKQIQHPDKNIWNIHLKHMKHTKLDADTSDRPRCPEKNGPALSYLRSRIMRPTNAHVDVALRSSHEIQASDLLSSHMLTTHARPHMPHAPQPSEWPHALLCADSRKKTSKYPLNYSCTPCFFSWSSRALQRGLVHPYIRTPAMKHYRLE